MSELVWVGGGSNRTNNSADWVNTVTGQHHVPVAGDTLVDDSEWAPIKSPTTSVMNIQGNELADDPLIVAWTHFTVNLSDQAHATIDGVSETYGTFNVSQGSYLSTGLSHGSVTVNLQNSTLVAHPGYGTISVNASGSEPLPNWWRLRLTLSNWAVHYQPPVGRLRKQRSCSNWPRRRPRRVRIGLLNSLRRSCGSDRAHRAARDVGEALLRRLGPDGQCDPAQATLAQDAACCDRTVRRAITRMRDLGLLDWQLRLIRADRPKPSERAGGAGAGSGRRGGGSDEPKSARSIGQNTIAHKLLATTDQPADYDPRELGNPGNCRLKRWPKPHPPFGPGSIRFCPQ